MQIDLKDLSVQNIKEYGLYVNSTRALPDYRDGLKSVQRRILWALKGKTGQWLRSAEVIGEVLGKYHPHGDTSVYGALVHMVNSYFPLIEGHGNWGNWEDPPAAYRYTQVRLRKETERFLFDLPQVMTDNYNGKLKEPEVLHVHIPLILINGVEGIGVGVRTSIPSFPPREIMTLAIEAAFHLEDHDIKPLKFPFPATLQGGVAHFSEDSVTWAPILRYSKKTRILKVEGAPSRWRGFKSFMDTLREGILKGFIDATNKSTDTFLVEIKVYNHAWVRHSLLSKVQTKDSLSLMVLNGTDVVQVRSLSDLLYLWVNWYRNTLMVNAHQRKMDKERERDDLIALQETLKVFQNSLPNGLDSAFRAVEKERGTDALESLKKRSVGFLTRNSRENLQKSIDTLSKEIEDLGEFLKRDWDSVRSRLSDTREALPDAKAPVRVKVPSLEGTRFLFFGGRERGIHSKEDVETMKMTKTKTPSFVVESDGQVLVSDRYGKVQILWDEDLDFSLKDPLVAPLSRSVQFVVTLVSNGKITVFSKESARKAKKLVALPSHLEVVGVFGMTADDRLRFSVGEEDYFLEIKDFEKDSRIEKKTPFSPFSLKRGKVQNFLLTKLP